MKKVFLIVLILSLLLPACLAEGGGIDYRFADAKEAAELLLGNRDYYDNLTQNDLNFRMQKLNATLEELEAFTAQQTLDFTDAEKESIDQAMDRIQRVCAERGYTLPPMDDIVFAKTTMREECDAWAYTHGTQIYLGKSMLKFGLSDDPAIKDSFDDVIAHEIFHCLTRNHPDFRAAMYAILGFTVVDDDYEFSPVIRDQIIANPDVEHHNSYAAFDINGRMTNCVVVFTTRKPFTQKGDSMFDEMQTGLVPIDDTTTIYTSSDAANFWDLFGRNTDYVIDPEETLADNFADTIIYGLDSMDYKNPEIILAIDALLKGGSAVEAAA